MRSWLAAAAGFVAGIAVVLAYLELQAPTSFEECFLKNSAGRSNAAFVMVARLCRKQFPAPPQPSRSPKDQSRIPGDGLPPGFEVEVAP